jgi:hypothetical protein
MKINIEKKGKVEANKRDIEKQANFKKEVF